MNKEKDVDGEIREPFNLFGHGVSTYISILKVLIVTFFVLTLLFVPVVYIYYNGGEFREID